MLEALLEPLGREALGRVTLLLNHVLSAEPEATRRLATQSGRTLGIQWQQWPAMLPPPPRTVWTISPAGLLDLDEDMLLVPVGVGDDQTLTVSLDGTALFGWVLSGMAGRPPMEIRGDAALAAEVSWLADHLRWDIEDDLARVIGDGPARILGQIGGALSQTLGAFVQRVRGAA